MKYNKKKSGSKGGKPKQSSGASVSTFKSESISFHCKKPPMKEFILQEYSDVFNGLIRFPCEPYNLKLKPDSVPAKHRPRKVPEHFQEVFHEEIERLVTIDVLEPVTEPLLIWTKYIDK